MSDRSAESGKSLPDGWHRLSIDEIKSDTAYACVGGPFGSNLTTKDYVESPGIPVIRGTNLSEGSGRFKDDGFVFVTERKANTLTQNMAFPGDLIFTQRGTLGQIGHIPRNARFNRYVVSQSQMKLTPNAKVADVDYLYHFFSSPESVRLIENTVEATGVPHINLGILKRLVVTLPPRPQQRKIARILTTVDNLIEKTEALIAKYQAIKQGMMHDLFTRGVDEHGHLRPPYEEAPELYKQSELGWIPKEWSVRSLGEVAVVGGGVTLGRDLAGSQVVELPYLRVANVQDGYLDLSEIKTVSVLKSEVDRYRLEQGDMLMTEGGDFDKLGRGTVWRGQISPCLHQNHIFRVRPSKEFILPDFLAAVTASSYGKRYFLVSSKQTTNLATINSTQLKAFPVPLPNLDEQGRMIAAIASVERQIEAEQRQSKQMQQTKTGLMQDLLTGNLRVKVDEAEEVAAHA